MLYNFEFVLGFLYFPRDVLDIIYEDLLYGYCRLPFELSGKVVPEALTLLFFFHYYYTYLLGSFEWRKQKII